MDVQDQLVKATYKDLDPAPRAPMGKPEPDEFDVDAHNVGACLTISCMGLVQRQREHMHLLSSPIHLRTIMHWHVVGIISLICSWSIYLSCLSLICPSNELMCSGPMHLQSNRGMWKKWDQFHKNISPGGAWNSTDWCRDYINVRTHIRSVCACLYLCVIPAAEIAHVLHYP